MLRKPCYYWWSWGVVFHEIVDGMSQDIVDTEPARSERVVDTQLALRRPEALIKVTTEVVTF